MKIKLDSSHYLESDPYNIWISTKYVSKNGKPYFRNATGYYQKIEDLMEDYIDKSILRSKAKSFTALKKDIANVKKDLSEWKGLILLSELNELVDKGK